MKLIFLDFDGVIIPINSHNTMDENALNSLNKLIEYIEKTSPLGIVITSDRRHSRSAAKLKTHYAQYPFAKKIIGKTSDKNSAHDIDTTRGQRIENWLMEHANWDISHIVIFDDNIFDIENKFKEYFVRCTNGLLTLENCNVAANILSKIPYKPKQLTSNSNNNINTKPLLNPVNPCGNQTAITALQAAKNLDYEKIRSQHKENKISLHKDCCHTIFDWALEQKDENKLKTAINEFGNIYIAAQYGSIEKVINLLNKNKSLINKKNDNQQTPLTIAVLNNQEEVAKLLIANDADLDPMNYEPLIHYAIKNNQLIIVEALLAKYPKMKDEWTSNYTSPLLTAVLNNNLSCVKLLLSKHPNLENKTEINTGCFQFKYSSALDIAIEKDLGEIADLLIKSGAKISDDNKKKLEEKKKIITNWSTFFAKRTVNNSNNNNNNNNTNKLLKYH